MYKRDITQKLNIYTRFELDEKLLSLSNKYVQLKERYGTLIDDILEKLETETFVPVSIFKELGCVEALVKYLKEMKMSDEEISVRLDKSIETVKDAYESAIKKQPVKYDAEMLKDDIAIPLLIFANKELTMLESTIKYLKESYNLKYSIIARLLGRNQRTIWTIYSRAVRKQNIKLN